MGQARQLGALGGGGQARDAQLHHARDGPPGRGIGEKGQGLRPRRGADFRCATGDHPGTYRHPGNSGKRRIRPRRGEIGEFDPKRQQVAASFTFMHNHTGSHLDTLGHIYRENALYNNLPAPKALGTAQGGAASVIPMVGSGVLLDGAAYKGTDPLPVDYWITTEDLQNTAKAQNVEIRKGDILLVRTGWRKTWGE